MTFFADLSLHTLNVKYPSLQIFSFPVLPYVSCKPITQCLLILLMKERSSILLALLNRKAIHRDYVIPNFGVVRLRRRCNCCSSHHRRCNRKLFVQTLSPLEVMGQLASNFI